jgi:hypothetical protein
MSMASATATFSAPQAAPLTALERHASFFDPKGTGVVTARQTYAGMKRLGVAWGWRVVLTPLINGFLGYRTEGRLSLVIRIANIGRGKHPYDSGSFADDGSFARDAFEALFPDGARAITAAEMDAVVTARGDRDPGMGKIAGVLGHLFSKREVGVLFCLAADTTKAVGGKSVPALRKETLRRFYDGTLFPELARRHVLVAAGCVRPRRR